mmetsp:Transcript_14394/g.40635  ORF Transcript_14394/g.40635 Transcript_14394/m.40635 type:complete len:147 (-) Transcript_14394:386-826(-)
MGFFGYMGRMAFAFIFISSGLQKLQTFDQETGGPIVSDVVTPALEKAYDAFSTAAPQPLPLKFEEITPYVPALFAVSCGMEVFGGLLFIFGSRLGSILLAMFLLAVTPLMHNFWDPALDEATKTAQMIHFFKNMSMFGAMLFYLDK